MNLFQTAKQIPISLPEICAPRAKLLQTFNKAAKTQYIYVQAPAGYGKTISTLLWLKKSKPKTIWISLDAYDNTPTLFYRLFCMSILSVIPHDEKVFQGVKSPSFNVSPVEGAIDLLSQLAYEDSEYAIVLDDFHVIQNEEIKKSLPYVLKRLPVTVKVIVLSRNSLPDSVTSLYGQETIAQIGIAELAFGSEEIRKHFATYGRFITKEEAEGIQAYTEGWAIALNAMVMSGNIDVAYKSQTLSLNGFIEKNVWSRLDADLREFLIKTSVPDKFTSELCEYLTESDHCQETLDILIGSNVNISLVGTEYRYHNLFLEFLRDKLNRSDIDQTALNKRVADYYLNIGNFLTAKNYAMKSGDKKAIAQAVRSFYSIRTFSLDEYVEFHKLYNLHNIPDEICDKMPLLYPPRIFFFYLNGDADTVRRLFDKLYPMLPLIADTYPDAMENLIIVILLDCRIKLSGLASRLAELPNVTLRHSALQSPTFTFQLPFLHRGARDYHEVLDPRMLDYFRTYSVNLVKQNLDIMIRGTEAGLLMEKNQLHEALDIAVYLKSTINESMSPEYVYAVYVLIAELSVLQNQRDKYEAAMKEAKEYISLSASQYLLKNLSAYEAKTEIMNGDKTAAEKWLEHYFVNDSSFSEFYKIYRNFTTARAYILLAQTDKAFSVLKKLRSLAESYDRLLDTAEADVLLAIVEWISGKKKESRNRLQNVLLSMQKYGFIRIIANEGKAVLPILSSVIKKMEKENEQTNGLYKFTKEVYITAYEQSKHFKGLTHNTETTPVKLSPQQKRVLELLAKGYKNAEIVEQTGLSLNTIRTHTKIAYQKLEVNNSLDAIVRAKQLGIIK